MISNILRTVFHQYKHMTDDNCIRSEPWQILCRVVKQEGNCAAGHKVGDEVLFTGEEVKGKICISAMYSMMPKIYAMMYNARFHWLDDQCVSTHAQSHLGRGPVRDP